MKRKSGLLIKRMRQARRYLYPEWELGAGLDPDFFEAYDRLYPGGAVTLLNGLRALAHVDRKERGSKGNTSRVPGKEA